MANTVTKSGAKKKKIYSNLLFQVLVGLATGILIGFFSNRNFSVGGYYIDPKWIEEYMKPLGIGFIKLIRMFIAPIIFGTVVVGIAKMGDMKKVGRVGIKALVYFEVVTTFALLIGLLIVNFYQPGAGVNADPTKLDIGQIAKFTAGAKKLSTVDFLMNIIPTTVIQSFAEGEILQVLFFSCLFGAALAAMGERGKPVVHIIDEFTHGFFKCIHYIMRLAPFGAGGAIAFAVSKFGSGTLAALGKLLIGVWGTAFLFVVIVLGTICKLAGFSLWKLFKYIKEEFFIVWGTSSSETVLPRLIAKLENLGIQKSVVGLVIPTGYSFNLDGTSIYLTMATVFIAQAFNIDLSIGQQLTILLVLMLTSKGAAAVAGGGFICLAATLASTQVLPVSGLVLLLGVDWFMSNCRALTNMIGNAAATVVVAKWEKSIDNDRMMRVLNNETNLEAIEPEEVMIEREEKEWNGQKS
ncbi:MAG TPA: dicarboxylate/amino acid:cation symporter [Dissulfurispiraceae bacterium]|nr:dicarboxylate/amino acid:cation symporter [Dissulfurispiraceae bacterium]